MSFLVIFFYSLNLIAQPIFKSSLELSMQNNSFFAVKIDNIFFPDKGRQFFMENIKPGQHYIEIFKYRKNKGRFSQPVFISNRWINIPANAKVIAFVDDYQQIRIREIINNFYYTNPEINMTSHESICQYMSGNDFRDLIRTLQNVSFESSRLNIAKQAISQNKMLSGQVKELMQFMWFESSKLELAKYAFNFTIDKENYYRVNNAFQFDSSIGELNEFIKQS